MRIPTIALVVSTIFVAPLTTTASELKKPLEVGDLAPDFKLGLVHYKELGEISDGAQVLSKLSSKTDKVRKRLERLVASGGGDIPERVEKGLLLALDPKEMGWRRETNKLIVVIGDAPPHPDALGEAVFLAGEAYRRPFGGKAGKVKATRAGRSSTAVTRPFVTACIGTGPTGVPYETRDTFQAIASAGGGAYAELTNKSERPGEAIVARILALSFGILLGVQGNWFSSGLAISKWS